LQGKYDIDFRLKNRWLHAFKDTITSKKIPSKKVKPIKDIPKASRPFLASCTSAGPASAFIVNGEMIIVNQF
jgi:hypothetical protein